MFRGEECPSRPWALVTDDVTGQNRAAVAAVRAVAVAGYRPAVTVCGRPSVAAASRYCRRRIVVPTAGHDGYAAALRRVVTDGGFAGVLPASDVAVTALGGPAADLVDKVTLAERARGAGLPVLPDQVFESADALVLGAADLTYPLVVKSAVKSGPGMLQARRVRSAAELAAADAPGRLLVQPYHPGPMRAVAGVIWDGELLAVCHQHYERLWPPEAGVACAARTVAPDLDVEAALVRLLAGHRGVFQAQFVGPYLLDMNPRVYGSLPLAVAAGANLAAIACAAAGGQSGPLVRARPGVRYRWLEGDLRHLATGVRRREVSGGAVLRRLAPRRGVAHSIESLRDPGPLLARLTFAVRRQVANGG